VVVLEDAAHAGRLAHALLAGGLRCAEVTLRTDAAVASIRSMAERPELLVGAGTVINVRQVDQAVEAGAKFVVSPGFSAAVVARCQELGVPVFPGVSSPTEFFPAEQLGGVPMLKALSQPFRSIRFIPTGGVSSANVADYLALASVVAVGGTWMVAPDLLAARDWSEVTARTRAALEKLA